VTASSLALFGPGTWSLDNAVGIEWVGIGWFVAAVIGGVGAALALLLALYRPNGEG